MRMVIILSQIVIVVIIKMIINFNSNDENYHKFDSYEYDGHNLD